MGVLDLVRQLEQGVNAGDVDALVGLFDPDITVVIPALSPKSGIAEARGLFEFCVGINVRWDFKESVETPEGAECSVDQHDGWSALVGIAPLHYESFVVAATNDRITSIEGSWSPATIATLGKSLEGFTPWAVVHRPDLYDIDGDFRYTREAGEGFIAAAREWLDST